MFSGYRYMRADEFDKMLNMGKAITHRFRHDSREWNYDGRSGFSTNFHSKSNQHEVLR